MQEKKLGPRSCLVTAILTVIIAVGIVYGGGQLGQWVDRRHRKKVDAHGQRLEAVITDIDPGNKSSADIEIEYWYKGKKYSGEDLMPESWAEERHAGYSINIVIDTLRPEEFYIESVE